MREWWFIAVLLGICLVVPLGVSAAAYYDYNGVTASNSYTATECAGGTFNITGNWTLNAIRAPSGTSASGAYIYNGTTTNGQAPACPGGYFANAGAVDGNGISTLTSPVLLRGGNYTVLFAITGNAYYGGSSDWPRTGNTTYVRYLNRKAGNGATDNYGNSLVGLYFSGTDPASIALTIRINDTRTNALVSGFSFNLTNGSVSWVGYCASSSCANSSFNVTGGSLLFYNISGGTYYNVTVSGVTFNTSNAQTLTGQSSLLIVLGNASYANVSSFAGVNYTRVLSYAVNLSCPSFSTTNLSIIANGSVQQVLGVSCVNVSTIYSGSYQYPAEGPFNFSFYLSTTVPGADQYFGNASFVSDLYNPVVSNLSFIAGEGFISSGANLTLRCTDSVMSNVTYNISLNGAVVFNGSLTNATLKSVAVVPVSGQNNFTGVCRDLFGSANDSGSSTLTLAQLILIDERTNTNFDVSNLTGVKAFFETASYMHDFKANGSNSVFFQSSNATKIRVELTYLNGVVINRYVSVDLLTSPIRVCANKEGVTHYEQLIISASDRPTVLKNVFSNCVIGADYTRFAYQDALLLKAYSINSMYYLYTFEGEDQIFLASVDGSISSYVNLDVLEFKQEGYNIGVRSDALSFEKTGATTIQIYYKNLRGDNTALALNITRLDTSARVATTADFANPNEFTFYFDYSTLDNVTNETLFKIALTKTAPQGVETFNRYFTTSGSSGTLRAPVAFAVAFLFVLFGLTLTMSRSTFGWFGIFIMIASLAVLSFAVTTWYITFLMGIDVILLVYICILLVNQNSSTVVQ